MELLLGIAIGAFGCYIKINGVVTTFKDLMDCYVKIKKEIAVGVENSEVTKPNGIYQKEDPNRNTTSQVRVPDAPIYNPNIPPSSFSYPQMRNASP